MTSFDYDLVKFKQLARIKADKDARISGEDRKAPRSYGVSPEQFAQQRKRPDLLELLDDKGRLKEDQ